MKRLIACALLCALCFSLSACGKDKEVVESDASSSAPTLEFHVAAVFAEESAAAAQLLAGAQDTANNSDASITFAVVYSNDSKTEERAALDALNAKETQGVLCLPVSSDESVAMLDRVTERGIPVSIAGVQNASTVFAAYAAAPDDYALGKAAGDEARAYIEGTLSGKANIAIVQNNAEHPLASSLRQNGFLDAFEEMSDVAVVGTLDLSSGGGKLAERITAFLKDHNDIDVIFCTTGPGLAALQEAVVSTKYTAALYGAEADETVAGLMRAADSSIQAVAAQDYFAMGQSAMAALIESMEGNAEITVSEPSAPIVLRAGDEEALAKFEERLV